MSASMRFEAFKPPNEKWQRMKAVYDSCTDAGIEVPDEVQRYFNDMPPDPAGVEIGQADLVACGAFTEYAADMHEGYNIDVTKLPKDVTVVRVYMAY